MLNVKLNYYRNQRACRVQWTELILWSLDYTVICHLDYSPCRSMALKTKVGLHHGLLKHLFE